jgi:hypothetical protein
MNRCILDVNFIIQLIKKFKNKISYLRKKHKENKERVELIMQFFDFTQPCPSKINNCKQLRTQYLASIETLKTINLCKGCTLQNIKKLYINKIIIEHKSSFTK